MGYVITQMDSRILIKVKDLDEIVRKVKLLLTPEAKDIHGAGGYTWRGRDKSVDRHYSWVDERGALNAKTFKEIAKAFRWYVEANDEGDIFYICFDGEKYGGDETVFLNVLAPYVEKGSYIEMRGEEGEQWKWYFDRDTCEEHYAQIKYPTLEGVE